MNRAPEQAVSPVVGVIVLVAVTVILSAVVGTFVLSLGVGLDRDSTQQVGVQATTDGSNVTYRVITGTADKVELRVNGSLVDSITDAQPGDTLSATVNADSKISVIAVTNGESTLASTTNPISTTSGVSSGPELVRIFEGFEDGDVSGWNTSGLGSSSFSASTDYVLNGTHVAKYEHNSSSSHDYVTLPLNNLTVTEYRFWVYRSGSIGDDFIFQFRNESGTLFGFNVNRQGTQDSNESIHIVRGGKTNIDTNIKQAGSTWYYYRFHNVDIVGGTLNYTVMKKDGTVILNGSTTFAGSNTEIVQLRIHSQSGGGPVYYIDDIYMGD